MSLLRLRSVTTSIVVLALACASLVAATAGAAGPTAELPLGSPSLKETRKTTTIAPGVTWTEIHRGHRSNQDFYTVDALFTRSLSDAEAAVRDLESKGYDARIEVIEELAPDDPGTGPLGYLVRAGRFDTQAEADAVRSKLIADGYPTARTTYTGEDGRDTTGPWTVDVLDVDLSRFTGDVVPELATDIVPGRELLTSISARIDSLAAINGGYFVISDADGTEGDLAGISAVDGGFISEAVNGRTSLIVKNDSASVAAITTSLLASSSDRATRIIDGSNREPGFIRSCGGVGGDSPTERPRHDFTCTDPSELIWFTPAFGARTEAGAGAEAILDSTGRVVDFRATRGSSIPPGGSVLAGTGDGAQWLADHAPAGARVRVRTELKAAGSSLRLADGTGIVNGGPRLLPSITAFAEGFVRPDDPSFYYYFAVRRNPRTMAGTTRSGHLLLVTVDGRNPDSSVGASFEEEAAIMSSLGATQALNLDGGGSTGMTVGDALVTDPSDTTGERPIGDALLLLPR